MQRSIFLALVALVALVVLASCVATDSAPQDNDGAAGSPAVAVSREALTQGTPLQATADTVLRQAVPLGNDGTGQYLGVTSVGLGVSLERSLVKFPTPVMPTVAGVKEVLYSARLEFTILGISASWLGGSVDINAMKNSWWEGTALAGPVGTRGATWKCSGDTNTTLLGNLVDNCSAPAFDWGMLSTDPVSLPRPFTLAATDRQPIFTAAPAPAANPMGLFGFVGGKVSFDVTADVQAFINGTMANNGWMIQGSPSLLAGEFVNFASRQNPTLANRPKLIITTGTDMCPLDANKGLPGQCNCGTPDRDTNLDHVADCFDAVAIPTADAALRLALPTANDGTGLFLPATSLSVVQFERSVVRFDDVALVSIAPARKITKAYLEFTVAGIATGWAGGRLALSRMNPNPVWKEGTGLFGHGVSWFCADDINTTLIGNLINDCRTSDIWWMSPVQTPLFNPFAAVPTASVALTWPGTSFVRFDVTADVQSFLTNPSLNNGWIIMGQASNFASGAIVAFGSRESSAPPRLFVQLPKTCKNSSNGKLSPGVCGCSVLDTNTDGDAAPDCIDDCPNNALKTKRGICGCNAADVDTDSDGLANCIDPCPADNDPTLGGTCGCPSTPTTLALLNTPCEGVCGGNGNPYGKDVCNGAGRCGNWTSRSTCRAPDSPRAPAAPAISTTCKPYLAKNLPNASSYSAYWICSGTKARDVAQTACQGMTNQSLVKIENDAVNGWVSSRITADSWIGANDKTINGRTEGDWRWAWAGGDNGNSFWSGGPETGTPPGSSKGRYAKWQTAGVAEPNGGATVDCAAMINITGVWQDRDCAQSLAYVCERPLSVPSIDIRDTDKTCNFLGNNCGPNTDPCVDPLTLPGGTDSRPDQTLQINACRDCTQGCAVVNKNNPTQLELDTCRNITCVSQCVKAALPPTAANAVICPDGDAYSLDLTACQKDPTIPCPDKHCKIQTPTALVTACGQNVASATIAGCPSINGQPPNCGELAHCTDCDPTRFVCPVCDPTPGVTGFPSDPQETPAYTPATRNPPAYQCSSKPKPFQGGVVETNHCEVDKYCGVPVADCGAIDDPTAMCRDMNLCTPPSLDVPPINAATLPAPELFGDETKPDPFAAPEKNKDQVTLSLPPDPWQVCNPPAACTTPLNNTHPWCTSKIPSDQDVPDQTPPSLAKPVDAGNGSLLSFTADPGLNLSFEMKGGPLGLPLPYLAAEAHFVTKAKLHILGMNKDISLLEMRAGASGGLHRDLALPAEDVCGFNAEAHATILGLDVIPGSAKVRFPKNIPPTGGKPAVDPQKDCLDAVDDFQKVVDGARKSLADAKELVRQYNAALTAGRALADPRTGVTSLCMLIAQNPPKDFPRPGIPFNVEQCKLETPRVTINHFISYYNDVMTKRVVDEGVKLGTWLDTQVGVRGSEPLFEVDKSEQITIFNTTFMVGPVPCNLEVLMTVQYGVNADLFFEFKIGNALVNVVTAGMVGASKYTDDPIFKIGLSGGPNAGVGVSLFAGVGFDIGFAAAKIGIDGAIDIGHVEVPVEAWAGLGMSIAKDARQPQPEWNMDTNDARVPNARLVFDMRYGYEAELALNHVLAGSLGVRLKLKFFFFSLNYRKAIVSFKGFCEPNPPPPAAKLPKSRRQEWCDIYLFKGGTKNAHPWATVDLPTPFFALIYLDAPKGPEPTPTTPIANLDKSRVSTFFYDSLCTCIPNYPLPPSMSTPPKQDCYRKEDCCGWQSNPNDAGPTAISCFNDTIANRKECTTCRATVPSGTLFTTPAATATILKASSCTTNDECCGGGSATTPGTTTCMLSRDPTYATSFPLGQGICVAKRKFCWRCAKDSDCEPSPAMTDGAGKTYPATGGVCAPSNLGGTGANALGQCARADGSNYCAPD